MEFVKGEIIYLLQTHEARSGMCRDIATLVIRDGDILNVSYLTAKITGRKQSNDGVRIQGCGMDMGFALVSSLAQKLFSDTYALKYRWL